MTDQAEPVLTFEQARVLRCALSAAGYTQEFGEEPKHEAWFAPEEAPGSSVLFFSHREDGIAVAYSDARVYRNVTFEEAMALTNGGSP